MRPFARLAHLVLVALPLSCTAPTEASSVPSAVVPVAAGLAHTMLVSSGGTLWATGANAYGQLGDGTLRFAKED